MKNRKSNLVRYGVQLFFFLLIAFIAINHSLAQKGQPVFPMGDASLHAVCPFGGVVSLYRLATGGGYVLKIYASSLILMIIVFVISVLFGPAFCGWICPFGSLQEWLGKPGRKVFKKKFNAILPSKPDRILRYTRYAVFAWVVFMTARSAELVFSACDRACPMNISVSTALTLCHHQCISCLKCTSEKACPVDVTVEMSSKRLGGAA